METVPKDIRFLLFGLVDGKTLARWSRVCKSYRQSIKEYFKFMHHNCKTDIHCFNESCCAAERDDLEVCKNIKCSSCKVTFCQSLGNYRTQCASCYESNCGVCKNDNCCKKVYCVNCMWQIPSYQECDKCCKSSCQLEDPPANHLFLESDKNNWSTVEWCLKCRQKCRPAVCYNCTGETCTCYRCAYSGCELKRVGCPNCSNNLSIPGLTCRNKCRKFKTKKEFGTWFL